MNKEQFLDELEKLLQDIDSIERDEALNYYRDYFEDAGSEHEQEVIDELGTPEKVAQTIKEGLDINEQENEEVIHHYNERNTRILRGIIVVLLVLLILPTIGGVGLLLFSLSYLTSLMTVSIFKYLPQAFRALIDLGKDIYNKVVG